MTKEFVEAEVVESEETKKAYIMAADLAASTFEYGMTIKRTWIYEQLGIVQPMHGTKEEFDAFSFMAMSNIERFKDYLLHEHKMALELVFGTGYKVVHPSEQSGYAMDKLNHSLRRAFNSTKELIDNTNVAILNLDEQRVRTDMQGSLAAMMSFSRKTISSTVNRKAVSKAA